MLAIADSFLCLQSFFSLSLLIYCIVRYSQIKEIDFTPVNGMLKIYRNEISVSHYVKLFLYS